MSLVKWGFIGLFLLPVAEIAAFVAGRARDRLVPAACLFLATSILGLLSCAGRAAATSIASAPPSAGTDSRAIHLESPGLGPMLGGILLVFPGFITDVLGALLLVPAVRRAAPRG